MPVQLAAASNVAGGGPQTWDECNPGIRQVEYQVDLSIYQNGN